MPYHLLKRIFHRKATELHSKITLKQNPSHNGINVLACVMLQSPRDNKAPEEHLTENPKKKKNQYLQEKKTLHYDFTAVITNPASYYRSHDSIKKFNIHPHKLSCFKNPRLRQMRE